MARRQTASRSRVRALRDATAVLLPMMAPGNACGPLWGALTGACLEVYGHVVRPVSDDLFGIAPDGVARLRRAQDAPESILPCMPYSLEDIRTRGVRLQEWLDAHNAHVFVAGDARAMQVAARLDLWRRETGSTARWIGIPSCPYNSVPFTDYNAGFPSTLAWCVAILNAAARTRARTPHQPVAVLEIIGDTTGWLTAGCAALADGASTALCLMPTGANELNRLYTAVGSALSGNRPVIVVCGAVVRDGHHRPIAPVDAPAGPALAARIAQHFGMAPVLLTVDPSACESPLPSVRVEKRDARGLARAAIRQARKAAQGLLVTARRAPTENYRLQYGGTLLTEAVNTPRAIGDRFVRARSCAPTPALAEYLRPVLE
jgi:hypothetical protein